MLRITYCSFLCLSLFLAASVSLQAQVAHTTAPILEHAAVLKDTIFTDTRFLPAKEPVEVVPAKPLTSAAKAPIVSKPMSWKAVLIPVAMISYGAYTFKNKDLQQLNLSVRREVWEERRNAHKGVHIDNFSILAPAVAVYALNIAGVKGKNNLLDRTLLYGMSNLIGTGITKSIKKSSKVLRPDSSNYYSFPSGHTTQAFIAAEFLRQEYKHLSPWYGIAGYAVAAGTGYLRMYNNKHWLNDVIAGAGVGIISTRLSYWLYPKIKHALFPKSKAMTMVIPTYQNSTFGIGLVHRFR